MSVSDDDVRLNWRQNVREIRIFARWRWQPTSVNFFIFLRTIYFLRCRRLWFFLCDVFRTVGEKIQCLGVDNRFDDFYARFCVELDHVRV